MFLLECATDNSLLIKRNESVICDHKTVACGSMVAFYHRKTKYNGTVRMISTDEDLLQKEIAKIKSADKTKIRSLGKRSVVNNINKINESSKRKSTKFKTEPPVKKIKTKSYETQDSVIKDQDEDEEDENMNNDTDGVSDISESSQLSNSDDFPNISPRITENDGHESPESFPRRSPLKAIETTPKSSRHSFAPILLPGNSGLIVKDSTTRSLISEDGDDDDDDDKDQLYGSSQTEKMKHIGNGILCKLDNYKNGIRGTPSATALARNLLVGVFKREALVKSSVAGRSPRAQGAERMKQENLRLHDKATRTIIKFAKDYAKKKNWKGGSQ